MFEFKPISEAPKIKKDDAHDLYCGPWILGRDKYGEYRVCRWTIEYPLSRDRGEWMYAYGPSDYIDTIISFNPIEFCELPKN